MEAGEAGGRGRPCIGYSVPGGPMVQCLIGGRFKRPENHELLEGLGRLSDVRGSGRQVHVLLKRRSAEGVESSIAQINGRGAIVDLTTPAVTPEAFTTLSISSDGLPAILVQEQEPDSARYILKFNGVAWQMATPRLEGKGFGPSAGAGLIDERGATLALTDADVTPWTFSVFGTSADTWENLKPPSLSQGRGSAQGEIVSDNWAMWQEQRQTHRGFDTKIKASRRKADGSFSRAIRLWSGISIGPGSLDSAEANAKSYLLYMRGVGNELHANIRAVR